MTARRAGAWLLSAVFLLLLSAWPRTGWFSMLTALAGLAIMSFVGAALAHPWLGARTYYRVRYHASDAASLPADVIAQGMHALCGQSGVVALVWRREGGDLSLYMEVPAALDEVVRGVLPRLLPEARVEVVPALTCSVR